MPKQSTLVDPPRHRRAKAGPTTTRVRRCAVAAIAAVAAAAAPAADPSPRLVASFTRQVQPLILNKCAAGACHGGPSAHAPRFQRGHGPGQIGRDETLSNMDAFLAALSQHDLQTFLATISRRHPADAVNDSARLVPLTPQERATLERWLVAAHGPGRPATPAALTGGRPAAAPESSPPATIARQSAAPTPNRFRALLEAAANPPMLPPPQEPKGIILGNDRGE